MSDKPDTCEHGSVGRHFPDAEVVWGEFDGKIGWGVDNGPVCLGALERSVIQAEDR